MYLAGLNSSSGVIIIADASKFEGVENRKRASVVGALLDMVFNMADLQRRQQTVSGFIQGSYQTVAADFVEVESTGCCTSKVGRISVCRIS